MNVELEHRIKAPREIAFAVLSDFEHCSEWIEGIERVEMLTDGPVGVGTRWRETRVMFGKEATEVMEVTTFEPSDRYVVECESCGSLYRSVFTFAEDGDGTKLTLTIETKSLTLMAKLMSPLGYFMMGTMKKLIEADITQAGQEAERRAGTLQDATQTQNKKT
ncbi:SRPBCC family protein [Calycomorphotria hydatis]|uniref:Polyketide cyclase / dehydrase and lipid transport n=1 Tax=Calycomorphotria hydatis TaxID=2528027 RepID=A0A517T5M7_9PLAN|nr:SRPBCC family protein [Calycomorphotria hydatis]QDT63685.1 Polyketide cyclase / dehydrase and lipid transport [Calycomorphotria hydatis]